MKQTAVEFAVEQLEKFITAGNQIAIYAILEQAKEMEKQQIEQAFNEGNLFSHNYDESGEKYYIYTFEK